MLTRYKKNQEKIAMGLLSFMPEEKDVKKLQATMDSYANNDNSHLYLYKEVNDIIGAIGLRITEEKNAIIQHISVNPSFRNKGNARKMIKELSLMYKKDYQICSNKDTEEIIYKCLNNTELEKISETRP